MPSKKLKSKKFHTRRVVRRVTQRRRNNTVTTKGRVLEALIYGLNYSYAITEKGIDYTEIKNCLLAIVEDTDIWDKLQELADLKTMMKQKGYIL